MESETKENNLSLSQDEEDVNLKNDTKPDVNNITKLEGDKIMNEKETETVDKESYDKLLLLYEFVTSDEFLEYVQYRAEYKDKYLHIASALGRLDMVQKLIEMGHNINMKNNEYKTPLYFAVQKNHLSIVKFLVENNAFINKKYKDNGFTPLHIAVQNNNLDIVKILVENNAFIDAQDKDRGFTPLHWAAKYEYLSIVKYLIENNAFIDAQDKEGCTPLHIAVQEKNNLDIVKYLVENNAFIDVHDDENCWTPLHWAVKKNNTKIVEYLCSLKDSSHLHSKDKKGRTPLDLAHSLVEYLYQWDADKLGLERNKKHINLKIMDPEIIEIIKNRMKF